MDGAYEPSSIDELNKEDKNSLNFLNKETERKFNLADIKYTLLSGVSLLTLTACGGGGAFGVFGGGGALLGGMLLKGPVSGARVFQDLDGDGIWDEGEPFTYSNPDGSYSLAVANNTSPILTESGIDTTTGAVAGSFKFDPSQGITTVTPVSVVVSKLDALIDPNTAISKFSNLNNTVDFNNYNPITSAAEAGGADNDAAIIDAVGAQMQATINGLSTLLSEISAINSTDPYTDAVNAIVAEINSGTVIDFENSSHIQNIFGRTSLSSSDYSSVVSNVSAAIAEVNKQIYSNFTEEGGNFLDTDARGIALLAQTDLVEAIKDLAGSPTADAASSFGAQFSEANITALAADLANKVPEFDPVTGAANIIASADRLEGVKGGTVSTSESVASNDVIVSGTAPLTPVGLSLTKGGETVNLSGANFTRDIANKVNHGFSTGQKISEGGTDYYLAKLDDNHFVLTSNSTNAQNLTINEAVYNQLSDDFTQTGHSFSNGDSITLFDSVNGIGQEYLIDTVNGNNFTLQGTQITDALFVRDIAQKNGHGFDTGDVLTDNVSKDILYVKKIDNDHFALTSSFSELSNLNIKQAVYDSSGQKFTLSNHGFSQGDEITLFDTSIGQAYAIDTVTSDTFTFVGGHAGFNDAQQINFLETTNLFQQDGARPTLIDRPNVVSDNEKMSFVQTDNLFQQNGTPALSYKSFLTNVTYTDSNAGGAADTISATLNSDGTVSLSVGADVSVGSHSIYYQVTDADGSVAVGPVTVDISPAKPTLSFQDTISDIAEVKDSEADYLEIPLHNYLQSINLTGSSTANIIFRGFDQDSLYQVSGTAKADNIGLFFTDTSGAPNLSKLTGVSDRSITITDSSQLNKISNNLVLRLDKDFSGEINLNAYMTVTENNRFASSGDVIKFNVTPVADTPVLTITDRSTDATIEVEGLEDQPIRIFQDASSNPIISLSSTDSDGSEVVTLLLRKNLTLADGTVEFANYVDASTGLAVTGTNVSHDFGNGVEDAIEISSDLYSNLSVKLGVNYEGNADITVAAKSSEGTTTATSSAEVITVYAAPVIDTVFSDVSAAQQGIEDTPFFVNLSVNQSDTGESLRVFVGDFEQKDANGNWVSVDPADIGGSAGFRPNIFATYSNDYFMFSQLENSTPLSGDGTEMSIEFLPLNDFNGDLRYKVFARTIETDGTSSDSSISTIVQNFDPRSENPNVEMGGNLTTTEYQGQSDYNSQKLGIGDLQVDMAENLELMKATVKFFDDTEYSSDPATASFLNSGGKYVTIDTSGVTNMSQISIDSSTPGQYIITAYPTTSGSTVTTTAVDNLKSAMAQIGILPPEDYSENSSNGNIRVEIKIQSKEIGANISDPDGGDFTLTVSPVAKMPTLTDTNSLSRNGVEDNVTKISDGLVFSTNDADGSESIVAVTISNVPTGFALVNGSGVAVGISDGAGSITLTDIIPVAGQSTEINYQLNGDIFLRAPNNYNGSLTLGISSTSKEANSGSTFTSSQSSLSINVTPVADAPAVSVPSSSTSSPIKIGENVNNDAYEAIRLNASVSEINTSDYAENLEIIIRMPHGTGGASSELILNGGESAASYKVSSGNDLLNGFDTYILSEAQAGKLQGATFKPPVGTAGSDYVVQVIGRSVDGSDVATTSQSITYNIAPVAKAPVINADKSGDGLSSLVSLSDGDTFNIDDLIKTATTSNNVMKLSLDVDPVANEQVTLLISNLPSGDFISFENANNEAIGARNADGSVFVFTLSEVDINNDGEIDASSEYIELLINAGQATLTGDRISSTTLTEFNQLSNSGYTLDGTVIKNSSSTPLQETDISFDLTGFALDQVGGTTASIGLRGSGELYHLSGGDPLIIDLTPGNGFSDNFTSVSNVIDINYDGTKDTVFMPNSNTGLLIFDSAQDDFASMISSISSAGELSVKDQVFSEYFEFSGTRASSSLEAISLLDSNNDKNINSSDARFSDIHIWVDADNDGKVDNGEFSQLSGNVSLSNYDTSVASSVSGGNATILRSADTNISYNSNTYSKVYEVALGHTLGNPTGAPSWVGKSVVFGDGLTKTVTEGLGADGSASFDLSLTSGSSVPNGSVTLVTVRGLPDELAFNKGAKLDNGDWLLVEEDIYVDPKATPLVQSDLKLIAVDDDYSGSFSLSSWAVTTDLLGGTGSSISQSTYLVGTVQAQTDSSNLFAVTSGVTGDEDDGRDDGTSGIPLTIRYALDDSDGSETIKIQLKVHNDDINSPTSNLDADKLKFTYLDGSTTKTLDVTSASSEGDYKIFELTGLSSFDDPKVTTLKVIPAKDYASSSTNQFLEVDVLAVLTDGTDTKTESVGPIQINVEEKADAVEMGYHSLTNKNDNDVNTTSIFSKTDSTNSSIKTYEEIASNDGTQLLSVNSSGVYDILSKNDGSNLNTDDISSIKLEITGIQKDTTLAEQLSQFQLVNGNNVFVPKVETGLTQNDYIFTVPSLKANESLKLVTPDNFDGNVSFSINSVVFANGDVALSQTALNLDVFVYSDGSPPEVSISDASALEDGPAFRLPINVTLTDETESITQMKLSSSNVKDVFYLTRLQNVSLDGIADSISDVSYNNNFIETPSLIIRFAPNFKASQEAVSLDNQIKEIINQSDTTTNKINSIETLFTNFGLTEGEDWNYYATGKALINNVEQTVFEQLDYNQNFSSATSTSGLSNVEFVENSILNTYLNKSDDVFTINISSSNNQGLAHEIISSNDQLLDAQIWLTSKIGIKSNDGVDTDYDIIAEIITQDTDNIQNSTDKAAGAFSTRDLNGSTTQTISVKVQGTNDLPIVSSNTSTVTYHEGGDHVLLVTDAQFSDIDNTTFNGGSINVEIDQAVIGDNVDVFSNSYIKIDGSNIKNDSEVVLGQILKTSLNNGTENFYKISITLTENADANDVTSILRAIGYKKNGVDINAVENVSYKISVQDGSGPDVNGNLSSTLVGNISVTPQLETNLTEPDAVGVDQANTQIPLFGNIDLTGNGLPSSIQLEIKDFVEGDVLGALGTTSSLVSSSYQSNSGILTLKNPTGSTDSQKLASFQDAINNTFYTTVNDNPTSLKVDLANPVDDKRIIEIKTVDNTGTVNVNEGRVVASLEVSLVPTDDLPQLNISNFERVSVVTDSGNLKVDPTFILPKILTDGGSDSLLKTVYDSSDITFDPDSRIKSLTIEINSTSSNYEDINLSKQQDKLTLDNNTTSFNIASGDGTNTLKLELSDENFLSQTLSENQNQIQEVLRNIKYFNESDISNLASGFRDIKIDFEYETLDSQNPFNTATVFDSSVNQSLPKMFIDSNFKTVDYNEGSGFANNETNDQVDLFDSINVLGRTLPQKVTVKIEDFVEGDLLFSSEGQSSNGELILTASTINDYSDLIDSLKYSSSNDNPDLQGTQTSRTINVYFNESSLDNISNGKIVAHTKVNIVSQDDLPRIDIYNFERVQIAPIDGELKVQETPLFPQSLMDETGVDALLKTGYDSQNFVFDPDSLIQTIEISVRSVENDQNIIDDAILQDKVIFSSSKTNQFVAIDNEKADITVRIPDEIISTQSLDDNKLQVLQTLRDLSYNNPESLENLVSGYRNVKIDFINQNGNQTTVFDSSLNTSFPKLLVGKAFQPGDTHVGLNMAINENQIPSDELIAKVTFTIETDYGYADFNDQLYILNEGGLITQSIDYASENSSFLKFEWLPSSELTKSEIISQLKDKIGFGGKHIELSGLRTIQVDIFNDKNKLIGPSDLKTTVFVQEDVNQILSGTENGNLVNRADIDNVGNEDIISYANYSGDNPLTIDIGFQTTRIENENNQTQLFELNGFEGAIGSSKDDIIIGGKGSSKLAGGAGNDVIVGDEDDFVDYGLEQAFSKDSNAYHLNSGINANFQTGKIKDTFGYTDSLDKNENDQSIKNIIGTSHDDIIIGSNSGSQIETGEGNDVITITGGNNKVIAGLGNDLINIEANNAEIYGDAPGFAEGKDTYVIHNNFKNITIQDFETNFDNLVIQLNDGENIEILDGLGTSNLKLRKNGTSDNLINVNTAAGIITATTLAIATTEVMALSDILPATESFSGGENDILDLSALSSDLFVDNPFNVLWEKDDQSNFVDIVGYENIVGGLGNDTILGFGDKSFGIIGGDGIDKLYGSELDFLRYDLEEIYRSSGNAAGVEVNLKAHVAQDTYGNNDLIEGFNNIKGTSLSDQLIGDDNNNIIYGNDGNDTIFGLGGNDTLIGGSGNDVLDGGLGDDTLTGDDGISNDSDLFVFKGDINYISSFGNDVITDFQYGVDTARLFLNNADLINEDISYSSGTKIDIGSSSISFKSSAISELNYDLSTYEFVSSLQEVRVLSNNLENLSGDKAAKGGYDDVVQLSKLGEIGKEGYFIDLGFEEMYDRSSGINSFNDMYDIKEYGNIIGSEGNDIILGGVSHNVGMAGGLGDDVLYGNSIDYLRYDLEEELTTEDIIGKAINKINDHVKINLGEEDLSLNDILIDARTAEDMWDNTDTIIGIENAYGTTGDDAIYGSANVNELYAGYGDDLIYGGSGSDILDGGKGSDMFVFLKSDLENANNDTDLIFNFNVNEDKLSFDKLGINDIDIELIDNEGGADAVLSFNEKADWGSIILVDVGRLDTEDILIDSGVAVG